MSTSQEECTVIPLFNFISKLIFYILLIGFIFIPAVLLLIVPIISFITFLHALYITIKDKLEQSEDTIKRDTLKYKLLKYVDYIDNQYKGISESEPVYMLFIVKNLVSNNIYNYLVCGLLLMFIGIIVVLITFSPLVINGFRSDPENFNINVQQDSEYGKILSITNIFVGFIFTLIIFLLYKLVYGLYLHKKLVEVKKKNNELDYYILKKINSFSQNKNDNKSSTNVIDKNFYDILINKNKDNILIEKNIKNNIQNTTNKDIKKQKALIYALYLHIYDQIPDTNQAALKLVQEYFFDEKSESDDVNNKNLNKNLNISYISLFTEQSGIKLIDKTIYKNVVDDNDVIQSIDYILDNINAILRQMPEYDNINLEFLGFSITVMIISIGIVFGYIYYLLKNNKTNNADTD